MLKIKNTLINSIKKSSFFWKYRDLFQRKIWDTYFDDSNSKRRTFYKEFIKQNNIKSVFEFGCASGPNYLTIKNHVKYFFGYDISKGAIKKISNIVDKKSRIKFSTNLLGIREFLNINKLNEFDLAIYDRVLYLLSEKQTLNHFNIYGNLFKYIIIDDFHSLEFLSDEEDYIRAKNYIDILGNFELVYSIKSGHRSWNSFTKKTARILIFKKK
tara:strand:- start:1398 stop:2036 length:639 start_codon:yes stop_codon:yes gene_type:complete